MSSRVYVPPSDDTLFMRGFSYHHRPEQIKEFFSKESGRCAVEFNKDDGNDGQFIALRFESRDVAKDVYRRFNDREILSDRITMTWYKDLRKVKHIQNDPRRYSGGMGGGGGGRGGGHYDFHPGRDREGYHPFRRPSGSRVRHHYEGPPGARGPRRPSRSASRSSPSLPSRSPSSTGSYESGEVHKRRGSRSSSTDMRGNKKASKKRRRHDYDSSESAERKKVKRMRRMKKMMRREANNAGGEFMDNKECEDRDENNVISIEADDQVLELDNVPKETRVAKDTRVVKEMAVTMEISVAKERDVTKDDAIITEAKLNHVVLEDKPHKLKLLEVSEGVDQKVENGDEDDGGVVENGEVVEKKPVDGADDSQYLTLWQGEAAAAVGSKEKQLRQQQQRQLNDFAGSEDKVRVLKEKKAQVEKAYKQDCETIVMVTKLLISKDAELEDRLQKSLRENLRDIGHRCIQELRDYVDRIKQ